MQLTPLETLENFIANEQLKFAVITYQSWQTDELAQSLAPRPVVFLFEGVEMVLISISKFQIRQLYDYINGNVEYIYPTLGSGKVTLLLHSEAEALIPPAPLEQAI
ncbi:hypothetical protein ACO1PK_00695 [Alishewanella sp. d11]|uniref:hypothetical protein n=1 Tax=Alishewanella sp. d11 TaxID=3414030 RepID=UPI003BF83A44